MSAQPSCRGSEKRGVKQGVPDFSTFHQKRIVISLPCDGEPVPFRGTAVFSDDERLGRVLRISLDDGSEIIISENEWQGLVVPDNTHACDYSEIILAGSQKVGNKWLYPGDIRIGMANRGYGPLVAGPEGASVLVIFATGQWPGITLGNNDGSTLATNEITDRFETV